MEKREVVFPPWAAEEDDFFSESLASRRLNFLLVRLALELNYRASVRAIAERIGMDTSQLYYQVRKGHLSRDVACRIEALHSDRTLIKRDWLMFPLEINTER